MKMLSIYTYSRYNCRKLLPDKTDRTMSTITLSSLVFRSTCSE